MENYTFTHEEVTDLKRILNNAYQCTHNRYSHYLMKADETMTKIYTRELIDILTMTEKLLQKKPNILITDSPTEQSFEPPF